MRRRTLLATVAALAGAGCSEVIPEPRPTVTTDARTTTDGEPTDSPPAATDTAATTDPADTAETTEAAETTDTATERPSKAERRAAETLATARDRLADAHTAFVGAVDAENATLVDVAVGTSVDVSSVTNPVGRAERTLDGLPAGATDDQRATADALRAVGTFLGEAARCQTQLTDAVAEFQFVVDRLYSGSTGGIPTDVNELRAFQATAADRLAAIEDGSSAEDAAAFDRVGSDTYTAKVEQLRRAVAAFEPLPDASTALRRGFDAFRSGADAYAVDAYGSAYEQFGTTVEALDSANDTLSGLAPPAAVETSVANLVVDTTDVATAAADFRRAAEPASRGLMVPRDAVEAGKGHLRGASDRVREWQATTRLLRQ